MFLFQIGAIKSQQYSAPSVLQGVFLFQIGAIKRLILGGVGWEYDSFYSKLVRLKGYWAVLEYGSKTFLFQIGAIKSQKR